MVVNIKDVNISEISEADSFVVDTNVLLFIHYPQPNPEAQNKANEYSKFISILKKRGCKVVVSSLNLQEAFYAIETICWKNWEMYNGRNRKGFRAVRGERKKVKNNQSAFLSQIKSNYDVSDDNIARCVLTDYVHTLESHRYDPIDYVVANSYKTHGIITNDSDFVHDVNVNVYNCSS
jgi:predicted nucleic acid-binding protein